MATEQKPDLLVTACEELAKFMDKKAKETTTGQFTDACMMELNEDLLDPLSLQPIADKIVEEFGKRPINNNKIMMLSEMGEMLASLQKEYYGITNRHARIERTAKNISTVKHAGSDKGFVRKRMKPAGGSY